MAYKELATKDYVNNRVVTIIDSFESERSNFTPDEILQMVSDKKILMINGYICTIYDMVYNQETNILEEVDATISIGNSFMDFYIYGDKTFESYNTELATSGVYNDISRLNNTISEKFRLIKKIVLTEDATSNIIIDTDSDNKSFSLKEIRIAIKLYANSKILSIDTQTKIGSSYSTMGSAQYIIYQDDKHNSDKDYGYVYFYGKKYKGFYDYEYTEKAYWSSLCNNTVAKRCATDLSSGNNINRVEIRIAPGTGYDVIKKNSEIYIYGIDS